MIWVLFPDTLGIPLEEVAAIFGDESEIYRAETEAEKVLAGIGNETKTGTGGHGQSNEGSDEGDVEKGRVVESEK